MLGHWAKERTVLLSLRFLPCLDVAGGALVVVVAVSPHANVDCHSRLCGALLNAP